MYQISGREVVFDWLSRQTDSTAVACMLDWMVEFATDPLQDAHRVPGVRAPVYLRETAVKGVTVKFLLIEQLHAVGVLEFGTLP